MAMAIRLICDYCDRTIEAWDDGNPYYLDQNGKKQYAYHPDHDRLALCIGNDLPFLCLSCGQEFMNDSRSPTESCPACSSRDIVATFKLDSRQCPYCKKGYFKQDEKYICIS
jgi:hypothetical protein